MLSRVATNRLSRPSPPDAEQCLCMLATYTERLIHVLRVSRSSRQQRIDDDMIFHSSSILACAYSETSMDYSGTNGNLQVGNRLFHQR
ncbi:hypothetical protein ZWY2020_008271 [Hordeum vulgare]|nr:hypothetical protein ZWY2020_008271 [Hordeum vulgare]